MKRYFILRHVGILWTLLAGPFNVDKSRFPHHPLAPEAGGDAERFHSGGRQFESQDDPDFQTIAQWIREGEAAGSSGP